jgi:CRISPR-associated endonuclease/helicase Cas3
MVQKPLYGHSHPERDIEEWQLLFDHLQNVAERAKEFAAPFQSGDWAYNAGLLHDLGKIDDSFQRYLLNANSLDDSEYGTAPKGRVNHSSAGAAYAEESFKTMGRIFSYMVAGHHAGLADYHSCNTGRAALTERLKEGKKNLDDIRSQLAWIEDRLIRELTLPSFVKPENIHLWIRMLFSALVDADYLDTEAYMDGKKGESRAKFAPLTTLKSAFNLYMNKKMKDAAPSEVNTIRREVFDACVKAGEWAPGLFSLTVPTGGGKTLSATAFALEHAIKHHKDRIIYVIPYTSIIEQTAKTLAEIFGASNVIEHHSNLDPKKETQRARLATENWDAPLVITTNVQFFESLYAAKPGRCRKLHRIANSVVILDEAQLLPPKLLSPCVDVMAELTKNYGVTLLFSTATQPFLSDKSITTVAMETPREIVPDPPALYKRLQRTCFHIPTEYKAVQWEELASKLKKHPQVLCVVNTRRDCYDLFKLMPEGTIHLSALMCGEHRTKVIETIKEQLKEGQPLRVISTQLVEAGVDIDFPVVYRAFAGLDSIAQAAGRCNREGMLNAKGELGQVYVFAPPKQSPPGLLRKGEDTTRTLIHLPDFDLHDPRIFTAYFKHFCANINTTGKTEYYEMLVRDVNPGIEIEFRTASEEFKIIDETTRPVFVRYGNSKELIEQLRIVGPKRELMRKLQRFTVALNMYTIETMRKCGLIEEIEPGFLVQTLPSLYSDTVGLDVFNENLPISDLMV